jgi:hypothetical protein
MIILPVGLGASPSLMAFKLGATTPIVGITSPSDGAIVSAGNVTISAAVYNFKMTGKLGQPVVPGEGHIHFFMDVDAPTTPGKAAVTSAGTFEVINSTSYTWQNVTTGTYTFSVELVNNDHTPLSPPAVSKVSVTASTTPTIKIVTPLNGTTISAGDVVVAVQLSNFKSVNKLGQANAAGEGHIHYFLDTDAPTTLGQPAVAAPGTYAATADLSYIWHNVPQGLHMLSVELVNNDHTPLDPPITAKISVTVIPAGPGGGP